MEKLSNLLDETTILNFRLLSKLVTRYSSHLIIAFLFFVGLFTYNYYSQPIIYSVNVPIKTISKHTVSSDLSSLLPVESDQTVSLSELNVVVGSYSFIKSLAENVILLPAFDRLNYGAITNGKQVLGSDIRKNCKNNHDCMIDNLAGLLGFMYAIEPGQTDNRFVLVVSALEEKAAIEVSQALIKTIELNRVEVRRYMVTKEIDSVDKLIKESREIIDGMNGFNLLEENEKVQTELVDLKDKLRSLQASITAENSAMTALEARVRENKKNLDLDSKVDRLTRSQDLAIRSKIEEVRQNIAHLSSVPDSMRSASDKLILNNLSDELKKLESKASSSKSLSKLKYTDDFGKQQEQYEKTFEFDYSVSKNKLQKLRVEYEETRIRIEELSTDKVAKESQVAKLKGDLEFLKNLETKQMSLKLMSSTMTSDLVFEEVAKRAREFRRSSMIKIVIFSFVVTAIIYLITVIGRYFIDDKIYSEEDLKAHFQNLDFIGEVPSFDA